jgi:hypothetical protein
VNSREILIGFGSGLEGRLSIGTASLRFILEIDGERPEKLSLDELRDQLPNASQLVVGLLASVTARQGTLNS